jgi:hypothetical protein
MRCQSSSVAVLNSFAAEHVLLHQARVPMSRMTIEATRLRELRIAAVCTAQFLRCKLRRALQALVHTINDVY